MITAPDKSWRYLAPPRTGSSLLHRVLQDPRVGGIPSGHQHDMEHLAGARIVVGIRDPFSRAVSLWRHRRFDLGRKRFAQGGSDKRRPFTDREYPFRQYLEERRSGRLEDFYSFSLCDWLRYIREVHDVIPQEHLWTSALRVFPELCPMPAIRANASRAAKTERPPLADPACVELVRTWARGDFARFGYSLEPPPELALE